MKKRIISFLLALVMVLGMLPVTVWAETIIASDIHGGDDPDNREDSDSIKWTLTSDGTLTFVGNGEMNSSIKYSLDTDKNLLRETVTSIVVGEGITALAGNIFSGYKNLESVSLPNTLIELSFCAFQDCSKLASVTIPDSVTAIQDGAFQNCTSLQDVKLPQNETGIELGVRVFEGCTNLRSITLPSYVSGIELLCFGGCTNLKEIYFTEDAPLRFNRIAFSGVNATVYYPAGNPTWTAGIMQNYGGNLTWVPYGEVEEPVTFSYNSEFSKSSLTYDYGRFNENWFFSDSYTYQHDLAQASIRTAMAAFGVGSSGSPTNITKLMEDLKFFYTSASVNYPDPTTNSIGSAIGHRTIRSSSGEESTLVLVAVRGGGYGEEWGGNFNVGTGSTHEGFEIAAKEVLSRAKNYINGLTASGTNASNIKVWVVGYSRAAATANLVAKELDDGFAGIAPKNVYAFCFACPQNTRSSNASAALYRNIFNIVNPIDLVPKVAMSKWDFTRYGTTYYLPAQDAYSPTDYSALKDGMQREYYEILYANRDVIASVGEAHMKGLLEITGQASVLDKFTDHLATAFISPRLYVNTGSQKDLMAVAEGTLGNGDNSTELKKAFINQLVSFTSPYGLSLMLLFPKNTAKAISDLILTEFNSHFPELYLAWIDSLDGDTLCNAKTGYRSVFVNCPVNATIYNADGSIVAQIIDDVVQDIEGGVPARIDDNGQKVIILPNGEEYTVDLEATGSGEMTYTVSEYDWDKSGNERVVSYFEQPIKAGDEFAGIIENLDSVETAQYPLSKGSVMLIPDVSEDNSPSQWIVTATAEGNGTVSGGGYFGTGEYAKVTAVANDGADFQGWYNGEKLVSKDEEYRFLVEEKSELTAKFHTHSFVAGVCTTCGSKDPDFKPDGLRGDADGSGVVDYVDAMMILQYHTGVISGF